MCNEAPNGGPTARGPLRATRFFLTEVIALSGIAVLPSLMIGVTSTDSHSMGVCVFLSVTDNVGKSRHKLVAQDPLWRSYEGNLVVYLGSSKNSSDGL